MRSFASDNNSGIHPAILNAIAEANQNHTLSYGGDPYTQEAICLLKHHFGEYIDAYFVYGGTGANVLGLQQVLKPYQAVLCAQSAHIHNDECGAPERMTGCKMLPIPCPHGKLTIDAIKPCLHGIGVEHHVQPRVISISQATEFGTVYTPYELKTLADFSHANGLLLHVDGARLANAAAYLEAGLGEITQDVGVDILSFGGAKNGMMVGECVLFFEKSLSSDFKYIRKQGMQLMAKMRFLAAQFIAYLSEDLWLNNARHANAMARFLAVHLADIPEVQLTHPVETNAVFATLPADWIAPLRQEVFFYTWNEEIHEIRWMTSFDTTEADVMNFVQKIKAVRNGPKVNAKPESLLSDGTITTQKRELPVEDRSID